MTAGAIKPILYSYYRSSCSWRVRIALAYKNVDYEYKAVNLLKGEQRGDEYLEVNPTAKVPALAIDGNTLTESMAIIEYLEETRKGTKLLPKDPYMRAQARALALQMISGIQPIQNLSVLMKMEEAKRTEWGAHWIRTGFAALERELKPLAGTYCMGDEVSIVDLTLVPQVYNALRFKVSLDDFPTIKRLYNDLLEIEEFRVSHPDNQPDTPATA